MFSDNGLSKNKIINNIMKNINANNGKIGKYEKYLKQ